MFTPSFERPGRNTYCRPNCREQLKTDRASTDQPTFVVSKSIAGTLALAITLLLFSTADCWTQTVDTVQFFPFVDDFEDGDAVDDAPVTWVPKIFPEGQRKVTGGNYVIGSDTVDYVEIPSLVTKEGATVFAADASFRTQLRLQVGGPLSSLGGVYARAAPAPSGAVYVGSITNDGVVFFGELLEDGNGPLVELPTSIDPTAVDVILQLDTFGNEIDFTVWEADQPKPEMPLLSLTDETLPVGGFGLVAVTVGNPSFVTFRSFTAASDADIFGGLQAGDADQDFDFDQLDLVKVQIGAKYLTGQSATWGDGDWNGGPGGAPGSPPPGDGLFNQTDIITALAAGAYLTGPYAGLKPNGQQTDGQTSVVYDATTGELAVDAPVGINLTSINVESTAGVFIGDAAQNLGGSFDNDADNNIFKATFGGSFGSVSFGNVAQPDLSKEFILGDLSVVGSLQGGGGLGDVDLVYVPEPTSALLLAAGILAVYLRRIRRVCEG